MVNGKRLRELRMERGMTSAQLREKSRVSKSCMNDIERGVRKHLNDATIMALAEALGMKPKELEDALNGEPSAENKTAETPAV